MWPESSLLRMLCRVARRARLQACLPLSPSWTGLVRELPLCQIQMFGHCSIFAWIPAYSTAPGTKRCSPVPWPDRLKLIKCIHQANKVHSIGIPYSVISNTIV